MLMIGLLRFQPILSKQDVAGQREFNPDQRKKVVACAPDVTKQATTQAHALHSYKLLKERKIVRVQHVSNDDVSRRVAVYVVLLGTRGEHAKTRIGLSKMNNAISYLQLYVGKI